MLATANATVLAFAPLALSLLLLVAYTARVLLTKRQVAWRSHAALRLAWFDAVSAQPGSEILAVQTLRNSLMTATMTASTAALGLMGAVGLAAPALADLQGQQALTLHLSPRIATELAVFLLLTLALVSTTLSIRHYHHAGFVCAMPQACAARAAWSPVGRAHLQTAGLLYSLGLRALVWVTPFVAGLAYAPAGPLWAALLLLALWWMDGGRASGVDIAMPAA